MDYVRWSTTIKHRFPTHSKCPQIYVSNICLYLDISSSNNPLRDLSPILVSILIYHPPTIPSETCLQYLSLSWYIILQQYPQRLVSNTCLYLVISSSNNTLRYSSTAAFSAADASETGSGKRSLLTLNMDRMVVVVVVIAIVVVVLPYIMVLDHYVVVPVVVAVVVVVLVVGSLYPWRYGIEKPW